jgi:large subunit ribosomal protein L40e
MNYDGRHGERARKRPAPLESEVLGDIVQEYLRSSKERQPCGSDNLVEELFRFLKLVALSHPPKLINDDDDRQILSPSPLIDRMWHELLLHPRLYLRVCTFIRKALRQDCNKSGDDTAISAIIPHWPRGENDSWNVRRLRYEKSVDMYADVFGNDPPEHIWPTDVYSRDLSLSIYFDGRLHPKNLNVDVTGSMRDLQMKLKEIPGYDDDSNVYSSCEEIHWDEYTLDKPLSYFNFSPTMNVISFDSGTLFKFYCRMLTGKNITCNASAGLPVFELKRLIQDTEGIPPDQQRILFGGVQMEDFYPIGRYNIEEGSVTHMVLKLRGC